jgi:hypothetical protein
VLDAMAQAGGHAHHYLAKDGAELAALLPPLCRSLAMK